MSTTVQFNKFHIGELIHNRDTNEDGKIVGFRDTVEIPVYEVIVPPCSLTLWTEKALEPSPLSSAGDS